MIETSREKKIKIDLYLLLKTIGPTRQPYFFLKKVSD